MTDEYEFLWVVPGARYVIVRIGATEHDRVIWDKQAGGILLIDDDDENRAVLDQMELNGVPVLTEFP